MNYKLSNNILFSVLFAVLFLCMSSCSVTKRLEKEEVLLSENKVVIKRKHGKEKEEKVSKNEILDILSPKANTRFLGIPLKLWVYNLYDQKSRQKVEQRKNEKCQAQKDKRISNLSKRIRNLERRKEELDSTSTRFLRCEHKTSKLKSKKNATEDSECNEKHWTRKLGEKPVIYKVNDEYRNKRKIRIALKNKGFFEAKIEVKTKYKKFNRKKIKVKYTITPGKPHCIRNIYMDIPDPKIAAILEQNHKDTYLKKGDLLSARNMESERERITELLRNQGYYNFHRGYIYFEPDTLNKPYQADVTVHLTLPGEDINQGRHLPYIIKNIYVYSNFKPYENFEPEPRFDTLLYTKKKHIFLLTKGKNYLSPKAIARRLYLAPEQLFSARNLTAGYKYLSSLPIINMTDISFKPERATTLKDTAGTLNCYIKLTQDERHMTQTALEITHSYGNWGIAGSFGYTNQNIFRTAEVFNVKINGSLRRITRRRSYQISDTVGIFNSYEFGAEIGLLFPYLLSPLPFKKFIKRRNPKTRLNLLYNYLKEPGFATTTSGFSFSYSWFSGQNLYHELSPLLEDFVQLNNPAEEFAQWIAKNQLEDSYEDHFILGSSYRFIFNNQHSASDKKNSFYINSYLKLAGNSLHKIMQLTDKKTEDGSYQFFRNTFAQFVKLEFDMRYYHKLRRRKDKIVWRIFAGAAYPYGNLKSLPFSEQYFSGGANGIRAWQERDLGPGSYAEAKSGYPRQRADIKLETNIEYRAWLFWKIEGALFLDIGNIWNIRKKNTHPEALFKFNKFYDELAVGSGLGLRFDFSLFIIRLDLGLKMRAPDLPKNNRWVFNHGDYKRNLWLFNFGIGYPF
ncbi:MAG: hypothetical protein CSB06_00390 [Bacteroidia bacterium]|nr:MAG: hypothetical protein CSB06_00390 [Bacteroidia bacterium]